MNIPRKPLTILEKIRENSLEAHLVGGCVRDSLLGRAVSDWDMTTSATPEIILKLFPKTVATGLAHGTVTVILEGEPFEVTTYRTDGAYQDNRHPACVQFVSNLATDLARRDFTINAMALDCDGNLTDLFGGQADLKAGILRCVGDPERRFREDALRMLRCVRFSAQLGFAIEHSTQSALESLGHLCQNLSAERVRDEVEKTLLSPNPHYVADMIAMRLVERWITPGFLDVSHLQSLPATRLTRWAGLVQSLPDLDLKSLRLDKKSAEIITISTKIPMPTTTLERKSTLSKYGWEVGKTVADLWGQTPEFEAIQSSGDCIFLGNLAVNGRDFPQVQGRQLGNLLQKLLRHVLEHPQDNQREILLSMAKAYMDEKQKIFLFP